MVSLEGINNKITVIKSMVYGLRDDARLLRMIRGAFPGIPRSPNFLSFDDEWLRVSTPVGLRQCLQQES